MPRNFTCKEWPGGGGGGGEGTQSVEISADASNYTTLGFVSTVATTVSEADVAALHEAYDNFQSFLHNQSLALSSVNEECLVYSDTCMFAEAEACIRQEQMLWNIFIAYLPIAIVLVSIALLFNTLSILFVSRVRHKFPRHVLLQNLSASDMSLSLFTVVKRSSDFLRSSPFRTFFLLYGNMLWQALWLISAFGILFLALDFLFATRLPFEYDKRSSRIMTLVVIASLWIGSILFTGLLVFFELSYSNIVQYVICCLMMAILLAIVVQSIYAFTLTERIRRQQLIVTLRDDKTIKNARKSRMKSSTTIAIIMTSSFISWLPLVVFFTVDESVHSSNVKLSHQMLAVCLVCFHMNAIINPIIYSLRFKDVRGPLRRQLNSNVFLRPLGKIWKDDDDDPQSQVLHQQQQALFKQQRQRQQHRNNNNMDDEYGNNNGRLSDSAFSSMAINGGRNSRCLNNNNNNNGDTYYGYNALNFRPSTATYITGDDCSNVFAAAATTTTTTPLPTPSVEQIVSKIIGSGNNYNEKNNHQQPPCPVIAAADDVVDQQTADAPVVETMDGSKDTTRIEHPIAEEKEEVTCNNNSQPDNDNGIIGNNNNNNRLVQSSSTPGAISNSTAATISNAAMISRSATTNDGLASSTIDKTIGDDAVDSVDDGDDDDNNNLLYYKKNSNGKLSAVRLNNNKRGGREAEDDDPPTTVTSPLLMNVVCSSSPSSLSSTSQLSSSPLSSSPSLVRPLKNTPPSSPPPPPLQPPTAGGRQQQQQKSQPPPTVITSSQATAV